MLQNFIPHNSEGTSGVGHGFCDRPEQKVEVSVSSQLSVVVGHAIIAEVDTKSKPERNRIRQSTQSGFIKRIIKTFCRFIT